jgi:hypothetical protein
MGFKLSFRQCSKVYSRAGKKDKNKLKEDLEKAKWYLDRFIGTL